MSIKQRLDADLKTALLAGQKDKVTTLRGIKSVILNAEIANNMRDIGLPDDQIIQLLNKEVKKRIESAEMYVSGGSKDRADKELAENMIIGTYLPAQLSDEELVALVSDAVAEVKPNGIQDMGKVIAFVKERSGGQADGSHIAVAVKGKLQG